MYLYEMNWNSAERRAKRSMRGNHFAGFSGRPRVAVVMLSRSECISWRGGILTPAIWAISEPATSWLSWSFVLGILLGDQAENLLLSPSSNFVAPNSVISSFCLKDRDVISQLSSNTRHYYFWASLQKIRHHWNAVEFYCSSVTE